MGCKLSPLIVQKAMEMFFRCHERAWPFLDDVTVTSLNVEDHLSFDLPKMLALASYYRLLLKPSKADILRSSARILGHQISEHSMSLAPEKIKKIEELTFPTDKKDLISKLAFFQYFNRVVPRLSKLTAPLRRLGRKKV